MKTYKEKYNKISSLNSELNDFWAINCRRNKRTIEDSQSAEKLINNVSINFDFTIDGMAIKYLDEISPAIDWLLEHYPEIEYSIISDHINPEVIRNGLSVNHCQTNIMTHRLNSHSDLSKCNSVLEIGAGFGAFAREILLYNNKMKYVIIDLPESLICSFVYLNLEFPNKKHTILYDNKYWDNDYDILYIPTGSLERFRESDIKDFDLFVNTCSMGEMINTVIYDYYKLVTVELNIKSVYWLNRFLNPISSVNKNLRKKENGCMGMIPKNWHIKHWEHIPTFLKCPYIINYHAKMVEIFADLMDEYDTLEANSSHEDEIFQLWNLYRLHPSYENSIKIMKFFKNYSTPEPEEYLFYRKQYVGDYI